MTVSAVNVEEFEQKYVNDVYERLARSCITSNNVRNGCRLKRWDKVDEFLTSFPCSSIIADLGFGDGRYLQVHDGFTFGIERCKLLCENISLNKNETLAADITRLPFRKHSCDGIICIDVIHHLATKKRRMKALHEIARLLQTGGKAFISVWGIEDAFKELANCDVLVPIRRNLQKPSEGENKNVEHGGQYLRKQFFDTVRNELNHFKNKLINHLFQDDEENDDERIEKNICNNSNIIFTKDRITYTGEAKNSEEDHRYYHVFTQKEFIELILSVKRFRILDTYHDKHSWVFVLSKK